jgi:anti-anti-sigma regulatory factor
MLRVSTLNGDPRVRTLKVEGRLVGSDAAALLGLELDQIERPGHGVVLELSGLRFADGEGLRILEAAAARGVELAGCSAWLASALTGAGP